MTALRILFVAYPMLPVSEESCGGAEQVLLALEREMARRGHRTVVAACQGSRVRGEVFVTGTAPADPDTFDRRNHEHTRRVVEFIARERALGRPFDLVHDHSGWFWLRGAKIAEPLLATLHLPRWFYPADAPARVAENVCFNCVSQSQQSSFQDFPCLQGIVPNGIHVERLPFSGTKSNYLLWLGRICEQKGTHLALEAARRAGRPLIVAGQVYPFSDHQRYFDCHIAPALGDGRVLFVEKPSLALKLELLRRARAVLLTPLVDETSSLVAMEAAACGTPVVALRRGALPEVVADGETGFLVESLDDMAAAIERARELRPAGCRAHAEQHFNVDSMAGSYESLYAQRVSTRARREAVDVAA